MPSFLLSPCFAITPAASPTAVSNQVRDSLAKTNAVLTHDLIFYGLAIGAISVVFKILEAVLWERKRKQRKRSYNQDYLQSDDWKRKRYVVLKRDNWKCVYCGRRATEVHHKKYARLNIGREPIEWLVSVCKECHEHQHAA